MATHLGILAWRMLYPAHTQGAPFTCCVWDADRWICVLGWVQGPSVLPAALQVKAPHPRSSWALQARTP